MDLLHEVIVESEAQKSHAHSLYYILLVRLLLLWHGCTILPLASSIATVLKQSVRQ